MLGGDFTFWLGQDGARPATQETGSRADASSPSVSTKGFDPARDLRLAADYILDGDWSDWDEADRLAAYLLRLADAFVLVGNA